MRAGSGTTGLSYPSWEDLLAAEANGYVVAVILSDVSSTGRTHIFARTVGPFATEREARNKAAVLRKRFRRYLDEGGTATLEKVAVEPLWKDIKPSHGGSLRNVEDEL